MNHTFPKSGIHKYVTGKIVLDIPNQLNRLQEFNRVLKKSA